MAIGLGIDFFFNYISVFIQIHYHDVQRVWLKFGKRHVIANAIIVVVVIAYFSSDFLLIFQGRRVTR